MTGYADRVQSRWADGATLDVAEEMMRLTLGVVGRTLFDADVESQARNVGEALTSVLNSFWTTMLPFADLLEKLPIPLLKKGKDARAQLDAIIYGLIAERRKSPVDRGDLLSMLLLAQDEEQGGRGMTDAPGTGRGHDHFSRGHETTANALAWTWYLLSGAPEIEQQLHEEVDRVLAGRTPTVADLPRLQVVERVITESMRLYPPAWIIGRRAIGEYEVGGYTLPPRTIVLLSPYVLHRDARFFAEPDRFMPARWTPEFRQTLAPFAYVPFGGGTRRCIGESFAWMELVLVTAAIAQRWRLRLVPGHPVVPQPVVTLRMKHGLRMTAERRPDLRSRGASAPQPRGMIVSRFAPAPTGLLHLGHVVNALHVWGITRAGAGRVLLRIEDHDRQRSRAEYEQAILGRSRLARIRARRTNYL
jgi:cytochrome P450